MLGAFDQGFPGVGGSGDEGGDSDWESGFETGRRSFSVMGKVQGRPNETTRLLEYMEGYQGKLRKILKRGQEGENPKVRRFCRRVLKLEQALWTFARHEGVEPTNNAAERAIRPAVLWRKGSYGNRSDTGCRFTERILTVVQTLRMQNRNVLDYLTQAVLATRLGQPCPPLVQ